MSFQNQQYEGGVGEQHQYFDIAVGVLLPIVCAIADPIVFKSGGWFVQGEPGLFRSYALFGYLEILIGVSALSFWLWRRRPSPILGGVLLAGALFAFVLGCVLLPFSFFGILFFGLGILGFSPFVTAFVFARNVGRLLPQALATVSRARAVAAIGFAFAITLGTPGLIQVRVWRTVQGSLAQILAGDAEATTRAVVTLRRLGPIADLEPLVWAYLAEKTEARRQAIAAAYREITQEDIEVAVARSVD